MKIGTRDIEQALVDILSGARSREDVASWASSMRKLEDCRGLQYDPKPAEGLIWESLEFLIGIDLKDSPDTYLHNLDDVRDFWMRWQQACSRL